MGFQDMPEVVQRAASRKGGRIKVKKGLGAMSEEKRKQITSMGGKARYENKSGNSTIKKKDTGSAVGKTRLADVLGDLDE